MSQSDNEISMSETMAYLIAGLLERDDLSIRGPVANEDDSATISLRYDDGTSFAIVVIALEDARNVG
jgi:hypothetical protein